MSRFFAKLIVWLLDMMIAVVGKIIDFFVWLIEVLFDAVLFFVDTVLSALFACVGTDFQVIQDNVTDNIQVLTADFLVIYPELVSLWAVVVAVFKCVTLIWLARWTLRVVPGIGGG